MKITKSLAWKSLTSTLVLGAVLTVTACGGAETTGPGTAPAAESPSASATPTLEHGAKPGGPVAKDGTPLTGTHGLKIKGPAENESGQYLQMTISDDDPALTYNPAIVDPAIAAKFTPEEITDAQKFVMTFFIEEGIDSTLNAGYAGNEQWIAREIDNFVPRAQETVKSAVRTNKEFINRHGWPPNEMYNYYYDKDSTRFMGYAVTPTQATKSTNPENAESILFYYDYEVAPVLTNTAGTVFPANMKGKGRIGVEKDPTNPAKWLISEMYTERGETLIATENVNPK